MVWRDGYWEEQVSPRDVPRSLLEDGEEQMVGLVFRTTSGGYRRLSDLDVRFRRTVENNRSIPYAGGIQGWVGELGGDDFCDNDPLFAGTDLEYADRRETWSVTSEDLRDIGVPSRYWASDEERDLSHWLGTCKLCACNGESTGRICTIVQSYRSRGITWANTVKDRELWDSKLCADCLTNMWVWFHSEGINPNITMNRKRAHGLFTWCQDDEEWEKEKQRSLDFDSKRLRVFLNMDLNK